MTDNIAALVVALRRKARFHNHFVEKNETGILLTDAADTLTTLQADLVRAEATIQAARELATAIMFPEDAEPARTALLEVLAAYPTSTALNEIRAQAIEGAALVADAYPTLGGATQHVAAILRARAAEIRNTKEAGE